MTENKVAVEPLSQNEILSVFSQYRSDLKSAHTEICKLQGLDPAKHDWPEWSPQANSLRWLDVLETRTRALEAAQPQEERDVT